MKFPSIFNDVIGPIMRGPSSSHCAAAVRIGRMARNLMGGQLDSVLIEFDPRGSLATTHKNQGSDIGIFGGLLGWDTTDPRLVDSADYIAKSGITVEINIVKYDAVHPNTYRITLTNPEERHQIYAISTGGGMVEITRVDGTEVSISGDYFETLIFTEEDTNLISEFIKNRFDMEELIINNGSLPGLIQIKGQHFLPEKLKSEVSHSFNLSSIKEIAPVLPIFSNSDVEVPFITCEEMILYNQTHNLDLWELGLVYESMRGGITQDEVMKKMLVIVEIIKESIKTGISGTVYEDRILHYQSGQFDEKMRGNSLFDIGVMNRIILYITALMETKSSMGLIVAAPTAGACGGLPGACFGVADEMNMPEVDIAKSLLAAGIIGVFISAHATFAAEVAGCQAECGAGSGMAAAALVSLANGTAHQAVNAASMALQNIIGMVCDPVANRVEVPCLGKNILAASNAISCANMALANFDPVIPLDEVIEVMDTVGPSIPVELRCTGLGGLSITRTSKAIDTQLQQKSKI